MDFMKINMTIWLESSLVTLVLSILASFLALYSSVLIWRRHYDGQKDPHSPRPLPPGDMGWPFAGETVQFVLKAQFFVERFARYGKIYKTHLLGSPTVRVSGAEYVKLLVSKEPHLLTTKLPASTRYFFGSHSLTSLKGRDHTNLKKKLVPSVSPVRLKDYLPCIQEQIRTHILSWCDQGPILGCQACENLMGDIMLEVVLGWRKDNDPSGAVRAAFVVINQNLFATPINIPGAGYYKGVKARKVIVDFVKRRLASKGDKDHVCMLDVFLAEHGDNMEGGVLTEDEIIDNSVLFLLAGTGTTSGILSCLLMLLNKHPDVLDKLRQELQSYGLLSAESSQDISAEILQSLEFTQSISKEALRVLPPVGGVFRLAEKTLDIGDYQIPQGWSVMYSIRDTHFNSTVFEDRDKFLPDRWKDKTLEERLRKTDVCNYLPFGSGPRLCLGKPLALMEMSVFLVELARLANWKLHNPEAEIVYLPVTKAADDLPVTFTRRK